MDTFDLISEKIPQVTFADGLKFLWDISVSRILIKRKFVNPYKDKFGISKYNKVLPQACTACWNQSTC